MPVTPDDIVREWLALADQDLVVARKIIEIAGPAAFHVQQAAEKALKAEIVRQGVRPPRTHDLEQLRRQVGEALDWKEDSTFLVMLTRWNTAFRYVDNEGLDQVDATTLNEALDRVGDLVAEVRAKLA